ncbi:hypothetical protein SLEP1_g32223 [Rubroshorea leprosula]|uniref:Uncharacterized protein n=1 Tax=Rubroshorea leprosula TaxID=152421 RepID=A0AAV5KCQ0_9ROSI|nr:hypothetical protein SLEP1_g32223 [Rubroshorea leprosula]
MHKPKVLSYSILPWWAIDCKDPAVLLEGSPHFCMAQILRKIGEEVSHCLIVCALVISPRNKIPLALPSCLQIILSFN